MTTSTPALNDSPVTPVPTKEESPTNPAAEAWSSFQENSANHQLSVLHEDGLYRHFRMSEPGTHMWSWDIVTWPGHLATSGDIADGLNLTEMTTSADGLTFSREPDMVGFFALANHKRVYYSDGAPSIDFRYWAEKLQGDQRETTREYKHENFIRFVTETLTECLVDGCRFSFCMSLFSVSCHQRVTVLIFVSPVAYWCHGRNPGSRRFFALPLFQQR